MIQDAAAYGNSYPFAFAKAGELLTWINASNERPVFWFLILSFLLPFPRRVEPTTGLFKYIDFPRWALQWGERRIRLGTVLVLFIGCLSVVFVQFESGRSRQALQFLAGNGSFGRGLFQGHPLYVTGTIVSPLPLSVHPPDVPGDETTAVAIHQDFMSSVCTTRKGKRRYLHKSQEDRANDIYLWSGSGSIFRVSPDLVDFYFGGETSFLEPSKPPESCSNAHWVTTYIANGSSVRIWADLKDGVLSPFHTQIGTFALIAPSQIPSADVVSSIREVLNWYDFYIYVPAFVLFVMVYMAILTDAKPRYQGSRLHSIVWSCCWSAATLLLPYLIGDFLQMPQRYPLIVQFLNWCRS
jgi:uncharacterized membrane protein